jgi:hypothetical protein
VNNVILVSTASDMRTECDPLVCSGRSEKAWMMEVRHQAQRRSLWGWKRTTPPLIVPVHEGERCTVRIGEGESCRRGRWEAGGVWAGLGRNCCSEDYH